MLAVDVGEVVVDVGEVVVDVGEAAVDIGRLCVGDVFGYRRLKTKFWHHLAISLRF